MCASPMKKTTTELRTNKDYELRPNKMFGEALRPLQKYLPLKTQGQWKAKNIFGTLLGCSIQRKSIHSVQGVANNIPAETSMWHHLDKFKMEDLTTSSSDILMESVMNILDKSKKYMFAIDFTDDAYYGKITDDNREYVIRSRIKKSTNNFYRYASLYLITNNLKITVAVLPVRLKVPFLTYIEYFLNLIKKYELNIKVLLLDREFYVKKIFMYLINENVPHIMPIKNSSKELKTLIKTHKPGFAKYTFKEWGRKIITVNLAIYNTNLKGKTGKYGRKKVAYVTYGINWSPKAIADVYKKRFSIESSYRMRNLVKQKTSSRSPILRYLLALISLLLKNVWESLKWKFFRRFKRGPPTIDEDAFRFETFITNLTQAFLKKAGLKAIRPLRWPER